MTPIGQAAAGVHGLHRTIRVREARFHPISCARNRPDLGEEEGFAAGGEDALSYEGHRRADLVDLGAQLGNFEILFQDHGLIAQPHQRTEGAVLRRLGAGVRDRPGRWTRQEQKDDCWLTTPSDGSD